jgi:chemotaxis protein methyltransferase CheR
MALSLSDFDYVRQRVRQHSAIVLDEDKLYLAEARLSVLARKEGHASVQSLVQELRSVSVPASGLCDRVMDAMATHETSFFRDLHPFEALRKQVLPELIQRRAAQRAFNIWCGACSNGQEPYSVAMLLRDSFPDLADWNVRIIASDMSAEVLERAREGVFSQLEVNRGLPARLLVKYFDQQDKVWRLKDSIRRMVEFRQINLAEAWPPLPALDIVLLRNVLIYFHIDTKRRLLANVRQLLRPDGVVFLGGAETTLNIDDAFKRCQLGRAVWYCLVRAQ